MEKLIYRTTIKHLKIELVQDGINYYIKLINKNTKQLIDIGHYENEQRANIIYLEKANCLKSLYWR